VRPFVVNATIPATLRNLTIRDGYGWELAGGVLNNGMLTLDHVTVANNRVATSGVDFWKGGAGVYNGDGSSLTLIDSTVRDNRAEGGAGGGVYAFFNTAVDIVRSTIASNLATDVGGGIRSLGDFTIVNSTISGNTATGWHGGAIFHTEGVMEILNSTITNNAGPDWAPSAIFLGEWGPLVPVLKLTNTIVAGNRWYACERFAAPNPNILLSGGNNIIQDGSCNPVASDQLLPDAGLEPLADNGGPTWTHALQPGSPALDAANAALCPARRAPAATLALSRAAASSCGRQRRRRRRSSCRRCNGNRRIVTQVAHLPGSSEFPGRWHPLLICATPISISMKFPTFWAWCRQTWLIPGHAVPFPAYC